MSDESTMSSSGRSCDIDSGGSCNSDKTSPKLSTGSSSTHFAHEKQSTDSSSRDYNEATTSSSFPSESWRSLNETNDSPLRNKFERNTVSLYSAFHERPDKIRRSFQPYQNKTRYDGTHSKFDRNNGRERIAGIEKRDLDRPKTKIGYKKLQELAQQENALRIAVELANTFNGLEHLLEEVDFLKERPDWIILLTEVFAKMCKCEFPENKIKVLIVVFESQFIEAILDCLGKISSNSQKERIESFLNNVYVLTETLVDSFPNASKDKLHGLVKQMFGNISCIQEFSGFQIDVSIKTNFTKLECRLRDMQSAYAVMLEKRLDDGEPPENFRTCELYPCEEEIFMSKNAFLRRNIVNGKYESVEHYLDVQFRLLREDLLIPLREGFGELVEKLSSQEYKRIKVNYLRYFDRCRIQSISTEHGTVSYDVCFDVDRKLNHINWEYNQWFKYGSLVFFSFDNFSSFIVGKVVAKKNEICKKDRIISVELIGDKELQVEDLNSNAIMVESTIFFQPYYQVMKALKQFHEKNFPLVRYIVDVNTSIQPPAYLEENSNMRIGDTVINVLDDQSWPTAEKLNLNQYQYVAFKAALTQEFAIMQGPPGTGKTFLGLKIVETLVDYGRKQIDDEEEDEEDPFFKPLQRPSRPILLQSDPILVVCYTNHALDQFLEGILKFTKSVVRVGSMSKSEVVKEYELSQIRRNFRCVYDRSLNSAFLTLRNEMKDIVRQIKTVEHHLYQIDYEQGIISYHHLLPFMSTSHQNQLKTSEKLIQWLLMNRDIRYKDLVSEEKLRSERIERELTRMEDNEDEDEARRESQNDENIIADIIKTLTNVARDIHALDIRSLTDARNKLKSLCENLEREENLSSVAYSRKRWNYESKMEASLFTMKTIEQQYHKINFESKTENLTMLTSNLQKMNIDDRWNLYARWVANLKYGLLNSMKTLEKQFRNKSEQLLESRQLEDLAILRNFEIVGITTTAAAKNHLLLTALKPRIVVVEEAAEVLEAHIVTALTEHCQHLILIGDHQQLRPNPTVYKLAKQYQLDVSLFERMINNQLNFSTLGIQHRMRPEICELITPAIYPKLENHRSVYDFENVKGVSKNLFFLTHKVDEEKDNQMQSFKNPHEGDFVLQLAKYLLLQGYSSEKITILTTYSGQLIHLKMEKKNESLLKDVRISTVDNYQGEECDIILLSLVRSNTEDKIGFLKISNRVCVALSRARKGLYIIGNMKVLVENGDIWKPINTKLEENEAIGPQLELKCNMHGNKTLVKDKVDFLPVSEGGCSIVCNSSLSCGHNCVRLCHSYDLNHQEYTCEKQCAKSCAEGHRCTYRCCQCSETCKPCLVQIENFQLKCGHIKDIRCHSIQTYECVVRMEVEIELCGHKDFVSCHSVTSKQIKCPKPCDIRLPCGHQCTRTCHKDDDPDHLEFKCMKKCEKLKNGCSQAHYCDKRCSDLCPACNERVLKKLECGHEQEIPCHLESMDCIHSCTKTLECGHLCPKLCKEKCGDCNVFVDKEIQECGHIVSMECKNDPNIRFCKKACQKQLSCGHLCSKKCNEPCISIDKCSVLVVHPTVVSLCAHGNVLVPCRGAIIFPLSKELLQDEGLKHCNRPCGETLLCGHTCKGTCSQCQQNRFHKVCNEKCNRVFLCGHKCRLDCSSVCPPCESRCLTKCPHKACKRSCLDKCDPCFEECEWRCKHQKCRVRCSETCNRRKCYYPCEEKLKCGHECIGFCGEPCPKKCRVCDEDEVNAALLGSKVTDSGRFVVLKDCGHFFESNALEKYLNIQSKSYSQAKDTEIVVKTCPTCEVPIVSTLRFNNTIKFVRRHLGAANGLLFNDFANDTFENQKSDLLDELKKISSSTLNHRSDQFSAFCVDTYVGVDNLSVQYGRSNTAASIAFKKLSSFSFLVKILDSLDSGFHELYRKGLPSEYQKFLLDHVDFILSNAIKIPINKLSQQVRLDYFCEIDRFHALVKLLSVCMSQEKEDRLTSLQQMWKDYSKEILCKTRFNKELSDDIGTLLDLAGLADDKVSLKRPALGLWQDKPKDKLRVFKCSLKQHMYSVSVEEKEISCPHCKNGTGNERAASSGYQDGQSRHASTFRNVPVASSYFAPRDFRPPRYPTNSSTSAFNSSNNRGARRGRQRWRPLTLRD